MLAQCSMPHEMSEKKRFSDVFRVCRTGILGQNGLKEILTFDKVNVTFLELQVMMEMEIL